jgi:hypothetical protein
MVDAASLLLDCRAGVPGYRHPNSLNSSRALSFERNQALLELRRYSPLIQCKRYSV